MSGCTNGVNVCNCGVDTLGWLFLFKPAPLAGGGSATAGYITSLVGPATDPTASPYMQKASVCWPFNPCKFV